MAGNVVDATGNAGYTPAAMLVGVRRSFGSFNPYFIFGGLYAYRFWVGILVWVHWSYLAIK
jgi:hypothetical protein